MAKRTIIGKIADICEHPKLEPIVNQTGVGFAKPPVFKREVVHHRAFHYGLTLGVGCTMSTPDALAVTHKRSAELVKHVKKNDCRLIYCFKGSLGQEVGKF